MNGKNTEPVRKIQLVGHCFADRMWLKPVIKRMAGLEAVETVESVNKAKDLSSGDSVLVINRVLDGGFGFYGEDSGIELIAALVAEDPAVRCVLVSNYAESQERAVAAGAYPGFGKSEVGAAQTAERLVDAVYGRR